MLEYALLCSILCLSVVGAVSAVGASAEDRFNIISQEFDNLGGDAYGSCNGGASCDPLDPLLVDPNG